MKREYSFNLNFSLLLFIRLLKDKKNVTGLSIPYWFPGWVKKTDYIVYGRK